MEHFEQNAPSSMFDKVLNIPPRLIGKTLPSNNAESTKNSILYYSENSEQRTPTVLKKFVRY